MPLESDWQNVNLENTHTHTRDAWKRTLEEGAFEVDLEQVAALRSAVSGRVLRVKEDIRHHAL